MIDVELFILITLVFIVMILISLIINIKFKNEISIKNNSKKVKELENWNANLNRNINELERRIDVMKIKESQKKQQDFLIGLNWEIDIDNDYRIYLNDEKKSIKAMEKILNEHFKAIDFNQGHGGIYVSDEKVVSDIKNILSLGLKKYKSQQPTKGESMHNKERG